MFANARLSWSAFVVIALSAGGYLWSQIGAKEQGGKTTLAATAALGGGERFLTHLSIDKPIYRPGEKLYARGVVLHHASQKPLPSDKKIPALVSIKGPKGDVVASGWSAPVDGVIGFAWDVPAEQAGGQYTMHIAHPMTGYAPAEREFEIRAYRAPRLKSQIKFMRDGYGPGDEVDARLHVERAEGGFPAGAKVTVRAIVDGQSTYEGQAVVDALGNCLAQFSLPAEISHGEGTLSMAIEDGGVVETAAKTIPILLKTVDVAVYPEAGDLVAGIKTRVYFEAFTPAGKPADLAGEVLNSQDRVVATFRSEHEGRGRFRMTPRDGDKYRLKITEPAGVTAEYELPEVKAVGAVIATKRDVYRSGKPVAVRVASSRRSAYVTVAKRERVLASTYIEDLSPKGTTIRFPLPASQYGVLTVTIWDSAGKPLAERLLFRQSERKLHVSISADARRYAPGDKAKLTVHTTDADGEPVSAIVGLNVSDDSVVELIEKREQAPNLATMVFLENEVRDLADAHIYLDPHSDASSAALDLLLGTQGWRRFAFVKPQEFAAAHGGDARRVLASIAAMPPGGGGFGGGGGGRGLGQLLGEEVNDLFFADGDRGRFAQEAKKQGANENFAKEGSAKAVADAQGELPAQDGLPAGKKPFGADAKRRRKGDFELNARLQQAGQAGGLALAPGRIGNDFAAVRIYAHSIDPNRKPNQRVDFTETLYWNAGVRTDEQGKAVAEFALNDSVTSFRVTADAFTAAGALGGAMTKIESVKPFYLEPKLPLEVSSGDRVLAPLALVNATDAKLSDGTLVIDATGLAGDGARQREFNLGPDARQRILVEMPIGSNLGRQTVTLTGTAGERTDQVTRSFVVKPLGFPTEDSRGGLLAADGVASHTIVIPTGVVAGSMSTRIVVYPTPLANMQEALSSLIRQPNGCFEQTSSTTYPLVMAQQYFLSHEGVDPQLIQRSADMLEKGYNRLIGFECPSGGFEWFGRDPGHDALTAYGIMEFTDMAQVRFVDQAMLDRTTAWMLDQRDGKGDFLRKTRTYHTWLADPEIANAYDLWALLRAGVQADLSTEVKWVRAAGERTQNSYVLALSANVLGMAGDEEGQNHLLDELSGLQGDNGAIKGGTRSVVGSTGAALEIETTSLAVLAWLQNPRYAANVEKSIKFLAESCQGGRFASTQSTILALQAIVTYDQSRAKPKAPGRVSIVVDGKQVGEPVAFTSEQSGPIELPGVAAQLTQGEHDVKLVMKDGSTMPYSVAVEYHRTTPASSADCALRVAVSLKDKQVDEGAATEARVVVTNTTDEKVASPIAIVGIPGGLEVRHDQLKELVSADVIASYEVIGREVVLYWRVLDVEQRVELPLSLIAAVPGDYTAPASRAYLYYTDELKQWTDGLQVTIRPSK